MLLAILVLQLVLCLLAALLLYRGRAPADPRHAQLPNQLDRVTTYLELSHGHGRDALAEMRRELATEARLTRDTNANHFSGLRTEVLACINSLGNALQTGHHGVRADINEALGSINQRLTHFTTDASRHQLEARDALHARLTELGTRHDDQQDKLRDTVERRLDKLNADNTAELEEMRRTVNEKLDKTLNDRLTHSFGQVVTHLGDVQKGLGEMKELATGVGDLKKVLSNVRSRGVVGEFQLGMQLEQMFSPEQYIKNARIKPNTRECVEYALKFPNGDGHTFVLLPIDAKFPKEDWERLEHAHDHGTTEEIAAAGRSFERSIRAEGKRINDKYIDPPTTMRHAIMFLPTENLYAEVVRRPGLQSEIQSNCHVTIAGPSTFMAILTSFQMGFRTLDFDKKGDEVRRVLESAKTEFEKFGGMMDTVRRQVNTVQNTLDDIGGKTRVINQTLKNFSSTGIESPVSQVAAFDEIIAIAPLLAAVGEND